MLARKSMAIRVIRGEAVLCASMNGSREVHCTIPENAVNVQMFELAGDSKRPDTSPPALSGKAAAPFDLATYSFMHMEAPLLILGCRLASPVCLP